jgi:membrane-bound metal-dependent hydrolase YbcI (DUF457 family)
MPGYKAHLVGGVAVYGLALYLLSSHVQPTAITAIEWLFFALAGSLFPDIDVKSKGQKYSYSALLIVLIILVGRGYFEVAAIVGILSMIPMIVRHRGLFHQFWFIVLCAGAVAFFCVHMMQLPCRPLLFDTFFFVIGAFSHLLLDRGLRW